jgi:hypothetical protein
MLFKGNHTNKVNSAVLLAILLFIHSIKLLHSHPNDNISANSHPEIIKSSADCGICSYQLNKDADDLVAHVFNDLQPEQNIFNSQLISFHRLSFHSAFETRGPPVMILLIS